MITISILGLDQFTIGDYSKEITEKLSNVYEISEDEILFYAPQAFIFHKGFDQSAYNVLVKVEAEKKFHIFEKLVYKVISETLSRYVIHLNVQFIYFEHDHVYHYQNQEYPLYMNDSNTVEAEDEYEEYDEDDEPEVYDGNVFEGFEDLLEKKQEAGLTETEYCEGDDCDCEDDDCECHCGCHDHHHN